MKRSVIVAFALMMTVLQAGAATPEPEDNVMSPEKQRYLELLNADWNEVFFDPCTGSWQDNWHLDGEEASISHSERGMDFHAGPNAGDDASHAVLWTLQSFTGDVKIEYEFTRLDEATEFVTILYVQATGSGEGEYEEDIMRWADRRVVPAMRMYFNHMNAYHVSYAAYDWNNDDPDADYIRARRYLPETGQGLEGTDLPPDHYHHTGLFVTDVPHRITVIKSGDRLYMHISNEQDIRLCHWDTGSLPSIETGRIGLRHMHTRNARYRNFRISVKQP